MTTKDQFGAVFNELLTHKYAKFVLGGLLGVLLFAAGFFMYRWRSVVVQEKAVSAFLDCMEDYDSAVSAKTDEVKGQLWTEAAMNFETGYLQNKSASFSPYFLAFQADALSRRGELEEAIQLMNKVVKKIPKSSPVYYMYKMKWALMCVDSSDEKVRDSGVSELKTLAYDRENPNNDFALFYLGKYFANKGDVEAARKTWNDLTDICGTGVEGGLSGRAGAGDSPFVDLVKFHIEQLPS